MAIVGNAKNKHKIKKILFFKLDDKKLSSITIDNVNIKKYK